MCWSGYVFAQAAAGSARPGRRRAARETRVRIRRSRRPRLDPLADRHPPIVPAAFRKLDAIAVLTARLLPTPHQGVPLTACQTAPKIPCPLPPKITAMLDPVKTVTAREGRDAARDRRSAGGTPPEVTGLLEQVQADHTPVDVIVVDNGTDCRPGGRT